MKLTWKFSPNREHLIALLVIAVLIGMITGALAVAFRYLLLLVTDLFWPDPHALLSIGDTYPAYLIVLTPVIGGLIVGPGISRFSPETRGAGVPEVIEAVVNREGTIHYRTAFFKALFTSLSIGCGASVGREGPVVHIGSAIGSAIAQLIRLPAEWKRVFLACGAAAGIAATFNAPMAGMLFAAEIILVDFQVSYLSHIAISAVTATVISHHFSAVCQPFRSHRMNWSVMQSCHSTLAWALPPVFFQFCLSAQFRPLRTCLTRSRSPPAIRPALAGALIGSMAVFWPHILGVGYESINLALTTQLSVGLMLLILALKLLATAASIGAGFSGGIFAPSLVLGSLLGGAFGTLVGALFPDHVATSAAYSLIGMGALCRHNHGADYRDLHDF